MPVEKNKSEIIVKPKRVPDNNQIMSCLWDAFWSLSFVFVYFCYGEERRLLPHLFRMHEIIIFAIVWMLRDDRNVLECHKNDCWLTESFCDIDKTKWSESDLCFVFWENIKIVSESVDS